MVGPKFSDKTYLILKLRSRIPNQDIIIFTKSPPEEYCSSEINIKEIAEEVKPLSEYVSAIGVFDDILSSTNNRDTEKFFIGGRHNYLDIYYPSHSFFDLPKRTVRSNSYKLILLNQTLKIWKMENTYRDVGGYDVSYDEIKEFCKKTLRRRLKLSLY